MTPQKGRPIPERKTKAVRELVELIKTKRTALIASIKDLPASQFQEIGKKLRGKAIVKVPKKNLIFRAIDESGKEAVKNLKDHIDENFVILFSDLDSFDLARELIESKSPARAKPGQEAPEDIEIQAGLTDLIPGPAVSELGALGIQIKIDKGKINIQKSKIIAKKGEKISKAAADLMAKLNIKPFSVGFIPLLAFDTQEGKLYTEINIDKEDTANELKDAHGRALPFAVEIGYSTSDTIKFLIGKAGGHGKALEKLKPVEEKKEEKVVNDEPQTEDSVAEAQESKQDDQNEERTDKVEKEVKENE